MVNEQQKMTIKKYAESFQVSDKTAKRDMKELVDLNLVIKKGVKKGAYFIAR